MVWHKANKPQQYIRTLKEVTMEATKSRILKVKELTVKKAKAKPKILTEKKFKQTLQQNKQFKKGACIKYKK